MAIKISGTTVIDDSRNITNLGSALTVGQGGTGVTSSTGTGSVVLSNSPTLSSPNLGAVGDITITGGTTGQYLSTDGSGGLSFADVSSGGGLYTKAACTYCGVSSISLDGSSGENYYKIRASKTVDLSNYSNFESISSLGIDFISNNSAACLVFNANTFFPTSDTSSYYAPNARTYFAFEGGGDPDPYFGQTPQAVTAYLGDDPGRINATGTDYSDFIMAPQGYQNVNFIPNGESSTCEYISSMCGSPLLLSCLFLNSMCCTFNVQQGSLLGILNCSLAGRAGEAGNNPYAYFEYKGENYGFIPAYCAFQCFCIAGVTPASNYGVGLLMFKQNGSMIEPLRYLSYACGQFRQSNCLSRLEPGMAYAFPLSVSVEQDWLLIAAVNRCAYSSVQPCCYSHTCFVTVSLSCLIDKCTYTVRVSDGGFQTNNDCGYNRCNGYHLFHTHYNTPHNMDTCPYPLLVMDPRCAQRAVCAMTWCGRYYYCSTSCANRPGCLIVGTNVGVYVNAQNCSSFSNITESCGACRRPYKFEMSANTDMIAISHYDCVGCRAYLNVWCACTGTYGPGTNDGSAPSAGVTWGGCYCSMAPSTSLFCVAGFEFAQCDYGNQCGGKPLFYSTGGVCHYIFQPKQCCFNCDCISCTKTVIVSRVSENCLAVTYEQCMPFNQCTIGHMCCTTGFLKDASALKFYNHENGCWYGAGSTGCDIVCFNCCFHRFGCGIQYNANTCSWNVGSDPWCNCAGCVCVNYDSRPVYQILNYQRMKDQVTGDWKDPTGVHCISTTKLFTL